MKYYKIITISLLLIISLAIGYYLLVDNKDNYIEINNSTIKNLIKDNNIETQNNIKIKKIL